MQILAECFGFRLHGLTTVPVLGKQVEEDALLRVLANDIFVELHAQSWPLWQREVPIYHLGIAGSGGFDPIFGKVVEVLLDFEIGR